METVEAEQRELRRNSSSVCDPYIRVPSDLFGERHNRQAPSIHLSMASNGRSAGVYPPARPLHRPQPWTLQMKYSPRRSEAREGTSGRHRRLLNSEPSSFSDSFHPPLEYRRCSYWRADVWQQQLSVARHFPLSHPLVRRKRLAKRMLAEEVLEEEAGGGGGEHEDLDGLIDLVARANDVRMEPGAILPVVRASPCAMHNRHLLNDRRGMDILYSTSCHAGKVTTSLKGKLTGEKFLDISGAALTGADIRQPGLLTSRSECTPRGVRDSEVKDRGGRAKGGLRGGQGKARTLSPTGRHLQYMNYHQQQQQQQQPPPRRMPPKLPEELPTKDVVMSWLKYGSVPPNESHFPDITQPSNTVTARRRGQHSAVSE